MPEARPHPRREPGSFNVGPNWVLGVLRTMRHAEFACWEAMKILAKEERGERVIEIGYGKLSDLTGLTIRGVRKGVQNLRDLGLIERRGRGGGRQGDVSEYAIRFQNCHHGDTSELAPPCPRSDTTVSENCHDDAGRTVTTVPHRNRKGRSSCQENQEGKEDPSAPICDDGECLRSDSGHGGTQATTYMKLTGMLGIREPADTDQSAMAKQARADGTCLRRIVGAVITKDDPDAARDQADRLLALGRELQHRRNGRMAAFVAESKERWTAVAHAFRKNGDAAR